MKRTRQLNLLLGLTFFITACGSPSLQIAQPSATPSPAGSNQPSAIPSTVPTTAPGPGMPASGVNYDDMFDNAESLQTAWQVIDAPDTSEGPSRWTIADNKLVQSSNIYRNDDAFKFYEGTHLITRSGPWREGRLSVKIKATDNDGVGLIFRYQDENNYYRFLSIKDSLNQGPFSRLEVKQDGVFRTLAESKTPIHDLNGGAAVQVIVTMSGSDFTAEASGQALFKATDSSFSQGKVGLMTYACSAEFTEFRFGK